ncbi:CGNR zinc finger domain-containing protein [Rhizohabitans arisaemae]|uniref:CGNR zinc finger domain-containing protein n=1 Tax=Rhizohabitans arisaemae TaxID=2720610 RepID=UPI0024B22208|nr:CGNR zinc finger domain-containing protein [Rhizohabitans arisaemae]
MHFNHYGGLAAEIAAGLVNTVPATATSITELLRAHDYGPRATAGAAEAVELGRWAGRLRPVFGEPDRDRQVDLVNELLADALAIRPFISRHDGRPPHLHYAGTREPIVDRVKAYTAVGLAHAVCEDGSRLGRCDRLGCGIVYVDVSRNGRRRFCSLRCANRVRVAEHRGRESAGKPVCRAVGSRLS